MTGACSYLSFLIMNFYHIHIDNRPQPLSAGYIVIIVTLMVTIIAIIIILGYTFGKPYWNKRHSYGWYNTLTTPSDWCDYDCFPSRAVTTRQAPLHQLSISSPIIYVSCFSTLFIIASESAQFFLSLEKSH